MEEFLRDYLPKIMDYKGRIFGTLVGLITGLLWAFLGFWRAVAFLICIFAGYYLGKKVDKKGSIRELLERILPPGD